MKIISWNINGLRSISKKGFTGWLKRESPDIVCLQEIKIQENQVTPDLIYQTDYYPLFSFAKRPGHSGVTVLSKSKPEKVIRILGLERFDSEGRILELKFPGFTLLNLYMPHGGRGKENLAYKLEAYKYLLKRLRKAKQQNLMLVGDFNVAHKEIDLARPKQNKNNIMFTPEERRRVDQLIDADFIDSFREFDKDGGRYTWWPYFANARQRNLGWRIDYCFVSKFLRSRLQNAFILKDVPGSDHCPIGVVLK